MNLLISIIDFYQVNNQKINPDKKITYIQDIPMKNISDLNNQFKSDEIIDFLKKDKTKYRVFSALHKQGLRPEHNNNRLAAFNIESINDVVVIP